MRFRSWHGGRYKNNGDRVEMFRKLLDEGQAGDNAGLLLRGVDKEDLSRGMVLRSGSITPHTKFKASVYVLKKKKVVVIRHFSMATGPALFPDNR